ncbi:YceI family protein [Pedobacter immunditicola]|uniref:YceI family protein n=1 Tax=Pedobacter immunditicola TaxID=3133440 RepID=UPI0030B060B6
MKPVFAILFLLLIPKMSGSQQVYTSDQVEFTFFSKAPIEDITARSQKGVSAIDVKTRSVYFKVSIRSFEFKKRLMQQHFNENYMESSKYPFAEFKGNILEAVDLSKDGSYLVTVKGDLNIHNVTKNYTVKGQVVVGQGKITAHSKFQVKLADHQIKIPRLVIRNIAEIVQVQVSAVYLPVARQQ